jgi:TolB-like protein
VIPFSSFDPTATGPTDGTTLPPAEALRIAAQLTDTEEDLHAITRVVLALVGADDDLVGPPAEQALAQAGIPAEARRLLMAALGPPAGRPSVAELRTGLEDAVRVVRAGAAPRAGLPGFIDELRRRRVIRTALWYAAASVAIVEGASLFLPSLGAPDGAVRFLAIAAVCGLPIALTLSWVFDISAPHEARPRSWLRIAFVGGVIALSAAAAVAIWRADPGADDTVGLRAQDAVDPAHIAVLGFRAVGGDEDLAVFATQLHMRLIDGLSIAAAGGSDSPRRLRVLSYAGVLPFTRSDFAIDSLRVARRVGTLLDGTIERATDAERTRVRVRIRLVDTRSGDQLHTAVADVDSDDRVALLDAVADTVARFVRLRLGSVVGNHLRLLETRSTAAFDHLSWAMRRRDEFTAAFGRADHTAAARLLDEADSLLAVAERHDPRWAEPMVARGRIGRDRAQLAFARGERDSVVPAIRGGIRHVERALALNRSDPRALEARGELRRFQLQIARPGEEAAAAELHAAAASDLRASLIGNPQPARPLLLLSELAGSAGHMQEALDWGRRAYDEDPFMEQVQITVFRLFEYSFALQDDAQAARWCRDGGERWDFPIFHDCRLSLASWSAAHPLSVDSAWTLIGAELAAYPGGLRPMLEPRLRAMAAAVLARQGLSDSARVVLRDAIDRDQGRAPGILRAAAGVHWLLGDTDSALAVLHELVERTPAAERPALRLAPELRALTGDPRARALLDAQPPSVN